MPQHSYTALISPFQGYRAYVAKLGRLVAELELPDWNQRVLAALNGEANIVLRDAADIGVRRKFGTFFTGSTLSEKLLGLSPIKSSKSVFCYDPTVGMGDLLLAAAKQLPLEDSVSNTLKAWGRCLAGTDLHAEFVEGTKTRLALLAQHRHGDRKKKLNPQAKLFPHIKVGNGLTPDERIFRKTTHVLLNPPFGLVDSAKGCEWSGGKITEAAKFVVDALEKAKPGTTILAILPDVLRSGSFTRNWRMRVAQLAEIHTVQSHGVFDDVADVDVFLLHATRVERIEETLGLWPSESLTVGKTVSDYFDVHVGRVVPQRDPKRGPEHPYIHPRGLTPWVKMTSFPERIHHEGMTYKPPFVAVRRTSRPGHQYRATATIISGSEPVSVENHLIVCQPKDGSLRMCKALMSQLKTRMTNDFLDERIRCRHLTVSSVEEIPFPQEFQQEVKS
jgi:hypothetical protein